MKTATYHTVNRKQPVVPFPNAASRRYFLQKFLDLALMAAVGVGIAASILFLMVLG